METGNEVGDFHLEPKTDGRRIRLLPEIKGGIKRNFLSALTEELSTDEEDRRIHLFEKARQKSVIGRDRMLEDYVYMFSGSDRCADPKE